MLLHRSELIPPPVLGFERFEENKYTSIKRRNMWRKMVTHTQKYNSMPQPVQGLGWVKISVLKGTISVYGANMHKAILNKFIN